jgi:3-hydroxyacyl-CoA dehydrogenase
MRDRESGIGDGRAAIKRAAVLGAGTMGSQIAGLLADRGIPCDLLDLRSEGEPDRLAESARERLKTLRPPPLVNKDAVDLIRPGNLDDHLYRLAEADWVIEAVSEDLEIKRRVWARAAPHVHAEAIVSTNTSGIPVSSIAEALPPELRSRFLGAHFCNPPRYLPLLEVIATPDTAPGAVAAVSRIATDVLHRGVVPAHDVPNFIANRVGAYALMLMFQAMGEFGLAPDEVDSVTGPAMGRPSSATFRTLDVVGIDVFAAVADNSLAAASDPAERKVLTVPEYLRELVRRGWTGQKAGQGFYKRVEEGGERRILTLNLDTFEYRPRRGLAAASLDAVRKVESPGQRIKTLVTSDDVAGRFSWSVLSRTMAYSAAVLGEVAADVVSIDRAMRWGYAWDLGPFETWDAIGLRDAVARMRSEGVTAPAWVASLAESGSSFYREGPDGATQATPDGGYVPVPPSALEG